MNCSSEKWASLALVVIFFASAQAQNASQSDQSANTATRAVHDEAMRILDSIKSTEYRHKTSIDEKKGAYYCDCSAFVGYVLNRTVAKNDAKGPFHDGRKKPLARDYEIGFAKAPEKADGKGGWQQVGRVADALPGDVIAWRHEKA